MRMYYTHINTKWSTLISSAWKAVKLKQSCKKSIILFIHQMITSMCRVVQRFPHPFKIEQKYWFIKSNYLTRTNIFFEFNDNWSRFVTHLIKSLKHFSLSLMLFSVQFYDKLHLFQLIVTARRFSTFVISNHWVGSSFTYYVPARLWRWK